MNNVIKSRFLSVILSVAFISTPLIATALTQEEAAAQIRTLLAQVQILQEQIRQLLSPIASSTPNGSPTNGTTPPPAPEPRRCYRFERNLFFGAQGDDVERLQHELAHEGLIASSSITGFFGPVTSEALRRFQIQFNIASSSSTTGSLGPLTRQFLHARCGIIFDVNGTASTTPPWWYPTTTPPKPPFNVNIDLSPISGTIGTTVTIYGSKFSADNTVLFGYGAIPHVPSTDYGTKITFTVPSVLNPLCYYSTPTCGAPSQQTTPGNYNVFVKTATNDISNAAIFKVTSSTSTEATSTTPVTCGKIQCFRYDPVCGTDGKTYSCGEADALSCGTQVAYKSECRIPSPPQPLAISGIDAPTTLQIGTSGTWTVHAVTPSATTTILHYSVTWGDEIDAPFGTGLRTASPSTVQSSATFTHTYQRAGIFVPTFTVADDSGHTVTTSATVTVLTTTGGQPTGYGPTIHSVSQSSGQLGTFFNIYGSKFTSSKNTIVIDGSVVKSDAPSFPVCLTSNRNCTVGVNDMFIFIPVCLPSSTKCGPLASRITQGVHGVVIQNANGTSITKSFSVDGSTVTPL